MSLLLHFPWGRTGCYTGRGKKEKVVFSGSLCYLLGSFDSPNSTSIEERDSFPWGLPEKAEESLLLRS